MAGTCGFFFFNLNLSICKDCAENYQEINYNGTLRMIILNCWISEGFLEFDFETALSNHEEIN